MKVKISVDYKDAIQGLDEISSKRFMKAWAIAIKNLAKNNVQKKASDSNGRSFWQREILPSIHEDVGESYAEIYSDSYIAQHVHDGGVIRPRNRKYLAIPLQASLRKKSPRDISWKTKSGKPVWVPRKNGNGYVLCDLFGRKKTLQPKFALVTETKPQRPRPWWPDEAAADAETERFFREDF